MLAGEGQFLKIFDHETKELLNNLEVFETQAIHGIICSQANQGYDAKDAHGHVLIWGGYSVSIITIVTRHDSTGLARPHIDVLLCPIHTHDWILDACFFNADCEQSSHVIKSIRAFLVNAHNEVLMLHVIVPAVSEVKLQNTITVFTSGPSSTLYSAHIVPKSTTSILVAAGTVFGEILLWSFHPSTYEAQQSVVHRIFRGHEGSVFGVQISEKAERGVIERILASCSDDRTIRLWNISDTSMSLKMDEVRHDPGIGFRTEASVTNYSYCVATVMGHASRIWGTRFLGHRNDHWGVLSYGEDATVHTWVLCPKRSQTTKLLQSNESEFELRHLETYGYHSGKNTHSTAIRHIINNSCLISTGGADGQIASYVVGINELGLQSHDRSAHYEVRDIYASSSASLTTPKEIQFRSAGGARVLSEHIFSNLRGNWQLSRKVRCERNTENCGNLEGSATFASRCPTNESYDREELYSEAGDFTTAVGLKLKTYRQYVWRFQKITKTITVWFVKPEDGQSVDRFFHALEFEEMDNKSSSGPNEENLLQLRARGNHLCGEDMYEVDFTFSLKDVSIKQWTASFKVSGPSKDYVIESNYTRDGSLELCRGSDISTTFSRQVEVEAKRPEVSPPLMTWKCQKPPLIEKHQEECNTDAFKTFLWLKKDEFLVSTENGMLWVGSLKYDRHGSSFATYQFVAHQKELESSCLATSAQSGAVAWLTGTEGSIFIYQHSERRLGLDFKLPNKVAYLRAQKLPVYWGIESEAGVPRPSGNPSLDPRLPTSTAEKIDIVATCLGSSLIHVLSVVFNGTRPSGEMKSLEIELAGNFIVTSSYFLDQKSGWLILGSRTGELAICNVSTNLDLQKHSNDCKCRTHRVQVHKESVTSILALPGESLATETSRMLLFTTGRDGTYKVHEMDIRKGDDCKGVDVPQLMMIHDCRLPFGPFIEGIYFSIRSKELFLWGFRSTHFVVWNESQKAEVLSLECGNSHRNWDYFPHENGEGGGSFAWMQAKKCHVQYQETSSHRVIQSGSHGRDIKAMALSPLDHARGKLGSWLLATGAEDTMIRMFVYNLANKERLQCLGILKGHTTGLQQLRWSEDGDRLFSAAGCEEFLVWRVRHLPHIGIGVICEAHCPKVTEFSNLRLMDFDVISMPSANTGSGAKAFLLIMAYSDSSFRAFIYRSWNESKFLEIFSGSCGTNCLTQVRNLGTGLNHKLSLCIAGTNGSLNLSSLSTELPLHSATSMQKEVSLWKKLVVHANSIKCLDVFNISPVENLIMTGGDDGCIAMTLLKSPQDKSHENPPDHVYTRIPSYHASAVTGLKCMPVKQEHHQADLLLFASVGCDQRLKLCQVRIDRREKGAEVFEVVKLKDVYTSVADAAALEQHTDDKGRWLIIAGIGMEVWRIEGI